MKLRHLSVLFLALLIFAGFNATSWRKHIEREYADVQMANEKAPIWYYNLANHDDVEGETPGEHVLYSPQYPFLGLTPEGAPVWTKLITSLLCYINPILIGLGVFLGGGFLLGVLSSRVARFRFHLECKTLLLFVLSTVSLIPTYLFLIIIALIGIRQSAELTWKYDLYMVSVVYALLQLPIIVNVLRKKINSVMNSEFVDAERMMGLRLPQIFTRHLLAPYLLPIGRQLALQFAMEIIFIELSLTIISETKNILPDWLAHGASLGSLYYYASQTTSAPWYRLEVIAVVVAILVAARYLIDRAEHQVEGK